MGDGHFTKSIQRRTSHTWLKGWLEVDMGHIRVLSESHVRASTLLKDLLTPDANITLTAASSLLHDTSCESPPKEPALPCPWTPWVGGGGVCLLRPAPPVAPAPCKDQLRTDTSFPRVASRDLRAFVVQCFLAAVHADGSPIRPFSPFRRRFTIASSLPPPDQNDTHALRNTSE
ncbi:uncharacterized protein LOC144149276 isoform X2 [Haemaphysalis longicornis]